MQNQQPVGQVGVGYQAPEAGGFFSRFSLWEKLRFGGLLALAAVGGVFALVMFNKAQKNVVVFENSLDKAGELTLNGKSYGTLEPRKHVRLELEPASYSVSFSTAGAKLDDGTLVVPKLKGGLGTTGYRAVYNLGGQKGLGVVTKFYGGSFKDNVRPIEEGKRLVEVPNVELAKVDDAFPESITVPKGASYGTVVRVCHLDYEKDTVGCPGW
jgi:hypothetical protein